MRLSDLAKQIDNSASRLRSRKPNLLHGIASDASHALGQRFDSGIGPDIAESTRRGRTQSPAAPALEDTMALFNAVTAVNEGVPYSDFDIDEYNGTLTIGVSGRNDLLAHQFGDGHEPAREFIPEDDSFWDEIIDRRIAAYVEDLNL